LATVLGFAGGAWLLCGLVAEVTTLQRNNYSQCSPMVIYFDVNGEAWETCPRVEGRRIVVFVM
jgi:hypothetical protein